MKILALCDSPTMRTGFACVARNLFKHWAAEPGVQVDVWGIGFEGWGYDQFPYKIFPGGTGGQWSDGPKLEQFLKQLEAGAYTHVWIMQDTFVLSATDFGLYLKRACNNRNIRSVLYYPVDGTLDKGWLDIIAHVDVPVAYTHWGRRETLDKAARRDLNLEIEVLPHGVDQALFHPREDRLKIREAMWKPAWVGPDDFLMLNVNVHQQRKDAARSLEILAELRRRKVPAKLLMHMHHIGTDNNTDLQLIGRQLGLTPQKEWAHMGGHFTPNHVSTIMEGDLIRLYNASDLYLSTSLGEGWGLGITEALACGCPVAVPDHTGCGEIGQTVRESGMSDRVVMLPPEKNGVVMFFDNSRLRYRVDVKQAVDRIERYYHGGNWRERPALNEKVSEWLDWKRIAGRMLDLLRGGRTVELSSEVQTSEAGLRVEKKWHKRIPVMGVAILNRGDLLLRLVRSIDFPVERLVVVVNQIPGREDLLAEVMASLEAIRQMQQMKQTAIADVHLLTTAGLNLGVAGAWNEILRQMIHAPYHLMVGNDIQFLPGDLRTMHEAVMGNLDHAVLFANHGHSFFAVTQGGREQVGSFDENIWPAYLEDCDHYRRIVRSGAKALNVQGIKSIHGDEKFTGSCTIQSDLKVKAANAVTHANNFTYYKAKWGGSNGEETFDFPFNDPTWDVKEWFLDPELRAASERGELFSWPEGRKPFRGENPESRIQNPEGQTK